MKKPRRAACVALLWVGIVAGLGPQTAEVRASAAPALHVQELRLRVAADQKSVSWQFSHPPTAVKTFALSAPARLVIDVSGPVGGARSTSYATQDESLWRIRQGTHSQRLRFVLDFKTTRVPAYVIEHDGARLSAVLQDPGGSREYTQQLFPPRSGTSTEVASSTADLHLQELQLGVESQQKTLSFHFSQSPRTVRSFALSTPSRLVLDVTGPVTGGPSARYAAGDTLVQGVRSGSHPSRLRFVVDLASGHIPPFELRHSGNRVSLVFALSTPEKSQAQVLFRRASPTALAARAAAEPTPPPAAVPAPAAPVAPPQEPTPARRPPLPSVAESAAPRPSAVESRPTAPSPPAEKKMLSRLHELWQERVDGVAFVKNETAFRLHSPRQFSKVQNWLEIDVDVELTDWATLTTIGRALMDPINHLESNIHDFAAGPIDRWASSDFFQAELRELYLEIVYEDFDFRFGRQQVVWGESLGLRILDVINPQDFREFILDDFIDARIPLWGTRIDYTFADWVFEGVWFLDFEDNRPADLGSEWQFREVGQLDLFLQSPAVQLAKTKKPQDGRLSDSEVGFRITRFMRNMDLSLNYFYAWSDFPVGFRRTLGGNRFLIEPRHTRFHLVGGTFNYAFDVFVIRGEGGLKLGQHFVSTDPRDADGIRQREFLSYVLGLDWTVNDNLLANFQFFQNVIFNKPKDIPDEAVNNIVSAFLRADFINETLFLELIALYGINFGELLIRPQVEYQINDFLSVTLGLDFFIGPRSGFFGQYAAPARRLRKRHFTGRNNRIFLEVKRSFTL